MKETEFKALVNYSTVASALAALTPSGNGTPFLLNATKIFQDGTMPKSGPSSVKKDRQIQMATGTVTTITRNKATTNVTGGQWQSSLTDPINKESIKNTKKPNVRHKVMYYVIDSNAPGGCRPVFDILKTDSVSDTDPGRDDDNQVRKGYGSLSSSSSSSSTSSSSSSRSSSSSSKSSSSSSKSSSSSSKSSSSSSSSESSSSSSSYESSS
jgi:hypothetical protein